MTMTDVRYAVEVDGEVLPGPGRTLLRAHDRAVKAVREGQAAAYWPTDCPEHRVAVAPLDLGL